MKKYHISLSQQERHALHQLIAAGRTEARQLVHARILLKADRGAEGPAWSDETISQALEVSISTIRRVRHRFIQHGLTDALNRRPHPERPEKRIFDGEKEAYLIALTCGEKPEGEGRWSLRLLSERLVKLGQVEQVSHETVRQALKKTNSNRGSKNNGVFHPKPMRISSPIWKMCSRSMSEHMTRATPRCVWMK